MPANNPPPSPTPSDDQARACPDDVIAPPVTSSTDVSVNIVAISNSSLESSTVVVASSTQSPSSSTVSAASDVSQSTTAEPLVTAAIPPTPPSELTLNELTISANIAALSHDQPTSTMSMSPALPSVNVPPQPALNIAPPVPRGPPATRVWRDDEPEFLQSRSRSYLGADSDAEAGRSAQLKMEEFAMEGGSPGEAAVLERTSSSESMSTVAANAQVRQTQVIEHFEIDEFSERRYLSGGSNFPSRRIRPTVILPYLRAGSRFCGTQQAERQVYDVQVDIKYADLAESYMCGYLKISGLTPGHPTLTTFFEGEIVGPKYSFFTNHPEWGANESIDSSHWSRFNAFRKFVPTMRTGTMPEPDQLPQDCVFMRWKEHFLVPDHTVRNIDGASFEGFYYICLNISKGEISGIYFHARSEKFQQLNLKHSNYSGQYASLELR